MLNRATVTAAAVAVFSAVLTAQSSWTLDQSAPAATPPADFTIAVGGPVDQVVSQTVTAGLDGRLRAVDIPIGCDSGTLLLEIRDVTSGGQPGPTVLASESYPASDFPGVVTDAFQRMRLHGHPLHFSAGDQFAISLSDHTGSCGIWPGPVGDPYAGGSGWADATDGDIVPLSLGTGTDDLPFATFVQ